VRPEQGLLGLRKGLGVFANLRPVKLYPQLLHASTIKPEVIEDVDLLVVRELTGGIYFGEKTRTENSASDLCIYHRHEVERIIRAAARLAEDRRGKLCSVDKANVLESSRFWRDVATTVLDAEFPALEVEHLLVDAAAMHLINRPADFDVIVTENMFGDILTDEASMLAGSLGMLPSASLGESSRGLYEPIHGSAPDIAGKGIANPIATLWSVVMMLEFLEEKEAAGFLMSAIEATTASGTLTRDLGGHASTREFTNAVIGHLRGLS